MKIFILLLKLIFLIGNVNCKKNPFPLNLIHEWKMVDIEFPNDNIKQEALQSGQYIPINMVPLDVEVDYNSGSDRRIFVTFPRFGTGRAFSLGEIVNNNQKDSIVKPYPDYYWHEDFRNCSNIVNAFRTTIDDCNRLWVMDNGKYLGRNICPPKLLVFDTLTDTLIDTYVLPEDVHENFSTIISPTLDIRGEGCKNTFVYLSDVLASRLIVVDYDNRKSWRIINKYFYPFPTYGTFNINGTTFELMDAIFGKALSPFDPENPNKDRTMYFSPLSSARMGKVATSVIRNQTIFINNPRAAPESFTLYEGERSSQSGSCVIDSNGIMFFGTTSDSSINCWNHRNDFGKKYINQVATDKTKLPFVGSMKLAINKHGNEELWISSLSLQKVLTSTLTTDIVNYRIFVADPHKLGQSCIKTKHRDYFDYSEENFDSECDENDWMFY